MASCSLSPVLGGEGWGEGPFAQGPHRGRSYEIPSAVSLRIYLWHGFPTRVFRIQPGWKPVPHEKFSSSVRTLLDRPDYRLGSIVGTASGFNDSISAA